MGAHRADARGGAAAVPGGGAGGGEGDAGDRGSPVTRRKDDTTPRKRPGHPRKIRQTLAGDLAARFEALGVVARLTFPSPRYRLDPVAFAREILGVEPWDAQVAILELVRDNLRVAVTSGHKTGKSMSAAILALWYFCSFDDARVVMSSTTSRQVDQILWRELVMLRARGGRCLDCKAADPGGLRIARPCEHSALIDGDIGMMARTGLRQDFREVVGFTAREAEAVAGISGKNLLYILDEASGIPEQIFEAIEGNRAGGARLVMFSNPTQNDGEFFDAFHGKSNFYATLAVSSETTPNAVSGRDLIPGLAGRAWIDEKREEWGESSSLYKVRVLGEFALHEDGRIFSIGAIDAAETRWHETPESGRLFIGLDPAGPSGSGDETVFAIRRGLKLLALHCFRSLDDEGHLAQALLLARRYGSPGEVPVLVYDREGEVGSKLAIKVREFVELHHKAPPFEAVSVRASDAAVRQAAVYGRLRDELVSNLEQWFRDGGAIPEDAKLSGELHSFEWSTDARGKLKATPKDKIRKELGRSPDRFDALALAVWEPLSLRDDLPESAPDRVRGERKREGDDDAEVTFDPYAAADAWR